MPKDRKVARENRKQACKNRYGCIPRPLTKEEFEEIKNHKCYGCGEGRRDGMRFFCIRAQCVKEISNFMDS